MASAMARLARRSMPVIESNNISKSNMKNLKAINLITAVLAVFWAGFVLLAGVSWWAMRSSAESLRDVHELRMGRVEQLDTMDRNVVANRMEMLLMFQHDPNGTLHGAHDHALDVHLANYAKRREVTNAAWKRLEVGEVDAEEKRLLDRIRVTREPWIARANQALDAIRKGDFSADRMADFLRAGRNEGEAMVAAISAAEDYQISAAGAAAAQADARHQRVAWFMGALALLLGLPGTIVSVALVRRLRRGFEQADAVAGAIAQGRLANRIAEGHRDEIGLLLCRMKTMQDNLVGVISQVRQSADSIEHAAAEVAAGNADLSHRTEQTASNLQQTASSADELGATVKTNADNAE